jgi:hypothetical protein
MASAVVGKEVKRGVEIHQHPDALSRSQEVAESALARGHVPGAWSEHGLSMAQLAAAVAAGRLLLPGPLVRQLRQLLAEQRRARGGSGKAPAEARED